MNKLWGVEHFFKSKDLLQIVSFDKCSTIKLSQYEIIKYNLTVIMYMKLSLQTISSSLWLDPNWFGSAGLKIGRLSLLCIKCSMDYAVESSKIFIKKALISTIHNWE